jgi:hypothetical protein
MSGKAYVFIFININKIKSKKGSDNPKNLRTIGDGQSDWLDPLSFLLKRPREAALDGGLKRH